MDHAIPHISDLLSRFEGESIDFKQKEYDFASGDDSKRKTARAEFVKDVLSMYNTPRTNDAFIVLGVAKHLDGSYELTGVSRHFDDAELQSKFTDWVSPIPHFTYHPIELEGKNIGLIRIPPNQQVGPAIPIKDLPSGKSDMLRKQCIYLRRSSMNVQATLEEQQRVFRWFRGDHFTSNPELERDWPLLLEHTGSFSTEYYHAIVTDKLDERYDELLSEIGLIDWCFAIDFDKSTDINGLLSRVRPILESRRSVHLLTLGDHPVMNVAHGSYWYCAAGLAGRSESIPNDDSFTAWNKKHGAGIHKFATTLTTLTAARPLAVLVIWNDEQTTERLQSALSSLNATFGDSAKLVFIIPKQSPGTERIAALFESPVVQMPIPQFCLGIRNLLQVPNRKTELQMALPSTSGAAIAIPSDKNSWLSEELQIVHLGEGQQTTSIFPKPGYEFLRGKEVSWCDLALNNDVPRDITISLEAGVRKLLGARRPWRMNLFHAPGAGGTTIAKRIVWDLHNEFPCMLLNRTNPEQTYQRLSYIAHLTGNQC